MTLSETEIYSSRRFRFIVAWLTIVVLILILVAILSHHTIQDHQPVWKSSPFGESRDTAIVKVSRDSGSQNLPLKTESDERDRRK